MNILTVLFLIHKIENKYHFHASFMSQRVNVILDICFLAIL
jgi:hypothetical protein